MEHTCTQVGTIEGLRHDVDNLVRWQKDQNGSIYRVEAKLDKLIFWFMTFAIGAIVSGAGTILMIMIRR